MAKQTGLAWTALSVDDAGSVQRDIRNDITDLDWSISLDVQETTGIDKSAKERLLLLADFSIKINGVCNFGAVPSATAHGVFATVASSGIARLVTITEGGKTLAPTCLFTKYDIKRDKSGELTYATEGVLSNGAVPTWS